MERRPLNVIGHRVRELRKSLGLTQDLLTARCQVVGMSITRSALARIEARQRTVTDFEVHLLAAALKTDLSVLFPPKPVRVQRRPQNPAGAARKSSKRGQKKLSRP
jgi:transcriptional regulator with XRE-family HTH domain